MKSVAILIVLTILISYMSCENNNASNEYTFEAEVVGRNSDCGIFAIKFTNNLDEVRTIAQTSSLENVYIAKNLPEDLQNPGLVILLNIRKPEASELGICTAMGPAYPWIYVTDAKVK